MCSLISTMRIAEKSEQLHTKNVSNYSRLVHKTSAKQTKCLKDLLDFILKSLLEILKNL